MYLFGMVGCEVLKQGCVSWYEDAVHSVSVSLFEKMLTGICLLLMVLLNSAVRVCVC